MIVGGVAGDGHGLLLLGLSTENLRRLADNEPILFDLRERMPELMKWIEQGGGTSLSIAILAGDTEEGIVKYLYESGILPPGYPVDRRKEG